MANQGFNELDMLRHRSPSPMASPDLSGWNAFPQEVIICNKQYNLMFITACKIKPLIRMQSFVFYLTMTYLKPLLEVVFLAY